MSIEEEVKRRRTFAIISHPDAGKTTLTEKFLLYGGAVNEAGAVRARKNQRSSTSDWMDLEKKRGISVSSTVLQFEYKDYRVNLLDTPGHEDFSEDTYRILTAVDAAIMVVDGAKGIEEQTKKLFKVCSKRKIPIFTFVNKLDRPTMDPIELLDQLESVLGISAYPINWPIGTGFDFKGVYNRLDNKANLFERVTGGAYKAPVGISDANDPLIKEKLDEESYNKFQEDLEMLDIAGGEFSKSEILKGNLTPVFFGSAMNNFGIHLLLDGFLEYSVPPSEQIAGDKIVSPTDEKFSGFIFKIQANMDPRHRDRIAFLRVCSGKFERNITVNHTRTGKKIKLSSSHTLFGKQRETVDEAYAGDIIGFVGNYGFGIGDTLTADKSIQYDSIPQFAPEHFIYLLNPNPSNYKKFNDGLDQLLQEGVIQSFKLLNHYNDNLVLGAVGPLQFEVVQYRLENEYKAPSKLERADWNVLRWISPEMDLERFQKEVVLPMGVNLAQDRLERNVLLFPTEWSLRYFQEKNHELKLADTPYLNN